MVYSGELFTSPFASPADAANPFSIYASFPMTGRAYFQDIGLATDVLWNYYNDSDAAVGDGNAWEWDQVTKPDTGDDWPNYSYNATTGNFERTQITLGGLVTTPLILTNPLAMGDAYEAMSYAAEPRSQALGAIAAGGGFAGNNIDLGAGSYSLGEDHSGQFMGTNAARRTYWDQLLISFGIPHKALS